MKERKKVYFASDMHFGAYSHDDPLLIERRFTRWLESIRSEARSVVLAGDIFDYWYEYRHVVPKGHTRVLGKLAEMADEGIEIHLFTGNHDIWMFDYLPKEIGCQVHRQATTLEYDGYQFFIAHGDEYVENDWRYRILRYIFHHRLCQRLYAMLHPWWTVGFARRWAYRSRQKGLKMSGTEESYQDRHAYQGEEQEYLVRFAKKMIQEKGEEAPDFFIFGHRHIMLDLLLPYHKRILILGDWIRFFSYAVWDGKEYTMTLHTLEEGQ